MTLDKLRSNMADDEPQDPFIAPDGKPHIDDVDEDPPIVKGPEPKNRRT